MKTPIAHSKPAMYGAIITIVCLVIFNVGYWVALPQMSRPALVRSDLTAPSSTVVPQSTDASIVGQFMWAVALLLAAVAFGVVGWAIASRIQIAQRRDRNKARKQALSTLAQGLEAYKAVAGRYPVGVYTTQRPVPATALGFEWESLGFPSGIEMRRYIPEWPMVDPLITYEQHNQRNQYLYYPLDGGEQFMLYAHLEPMNAKDVLPSYNQPDGLPTAWGEYNYKMGPHVVGQSAVSQPTVSLQPPAVPEAEIAPTAPPPVAVTVVSPQPPQPVAPPIQQAAPEPSPARPDTNKPVDPQPLSEAELYRLGETAKQSQPSSLLPEKSQS